MRDHLHLILSTDATIDDIERYGMLAWMRAMVETYGAAFELDFYTADHRSCSDLLGVRHHPCCPRALSFLPRRIRQLIFYAALLFRAPRMKGVIRVLSPNMAILPEIRGLSQTPTIADFHYDWSEKTRADYRGPKRALAGFVQRRCMRGADLVIASTAELRHRAKEEYSRRVIHIPNFVDQTLFHPGRERERKVVFAGRLHWAKGCDVLVEAFRRIAPRHPEVNLVIMGAGEEEERILNLVPPDLRDRVELLGSVPQAELAAQLGSAAIFAFPTVTVEGQPKALIEAMACGTPCVGTSVPGVEGLIRDGHNGLLVAPGDAGALAHALDRLISDENLWRRLSENCLKTSRRFEKEPVLRRQVRVMRWWASRNGKRDSAIDQC